MKKNTTMYNPSIKCLISKKEAVYEKKEFLCYYLKGKMQKLWAWLILL